MRHEFERTWSNAWEAWKLDQPKALSWARLKFVKRFWEVRKYFEKNFKKVLDKSETAWYNNKAVTKETAFQEDENLPMEVIRTGKTVGLRGSDENLEELEN